MKEACEKLAELVLSFIFAALLATGWVVSGSRPQAVADERQQLIDDVTAAGYEVVADRLKDTTQPEFVERVRDAMQDDRITEAEYEALKVMHEAMRKAKAKQAIRSELARRAKQP